MMFALIRYQTSMSFEEWCTSCMVDQNVTWAELPWISSQLLLLLQCGKVIPCPIHIPMRLEKSHLSENASENGGESTST